jgi:hypothetical protein
MFAALAAATSLLAACVGVRSDQASSTFSDGTKWSISGCDSVSSAGGFSGPVAASAQAAVDKYVAGGSTGRDPIPTTGWHVLRRKATSIEFGSGKDLLLVTERADTWKVTDYAVCVK